MQNSLKNTYLKIIILIEVIIIFLLINKIFYKKQKNTLVAFVENINKEDVVFDSINTDTGLKYFYEPKANKKIMDEPAWLPNKAIYTINVDSLNERFDYAIEKKSNSYRIITLGDSNTFGLYVNTKYNYSERLEDLLNSQCNGLNTVDVINLGVDGYDINYSVERYRKRGMKYNSDLVIWFIGIWDYTKINEAIIPEAQEEFNQATVNDQEDSYDYKYYLWTEQEKFAKGQQYNLLNMQFNYFKEFREIYQGKLIIFVFKDQIKNEKGGNGFSAFIDAVHDSDNNILVFPDISYKDLETLKSDPHLNEKDHFIISEKIAEFLKQKNLNPCSL